MANFHGTDSPEIGRSLDCFQLTPFWELPWRAIAIQFFLASMKTSPEQTLLNLGMTMWMGITHLVSSLRCLYIS
ncbi:MAG: hypothetical protein AAGA75_17670 [Cyanobacteria bacterium P01_E01_bin.6]